MTRERGSASLEFVVVGFGVLVPILAVTVSATALQTAQFASTEISRQGVRAFAQATTTSTGKATVRRIARLSMNDFGIPGTARIAVSCVPTNCQSQGALVRLTTTITVELPMVPVLPGLEVLRRIPVSATAHHRTPLPSAP
ncbi:MAG: hypothetical protein ACKOWN_00575 [Microbacteriaceae bacterium]